MFARMLLISLLLASSAVAEIRTWTDATGKHQIRAELLNADAETVLLRIETRDKTVPLDRLSDADQRYVRDWLESRERELNENLDPLKVGEQDNAAKAAAAQPVTGLVYVLPNGTRYHDKSCSLVTGECTKLTLDEARTLKLHPCIHCHPELRKKLASDEERTPREPRPRRSYNRYRAPMNPFGGLGYDAAGSRSDGRWGQQS
jgi:hypothetical protein